MNVEAILKFADDNKFFKKFLSKYDLYQLNQQNLKEIYLKIGEYLFEQKFVRQVLSCFKNEILSILHLAVPLDENVKLKHEEHLLNCTMLASLVGQHPDVKKFIFGYFNKFPSPFECDNNELCPPTKKIKRIKTKMVSDLDIVKASHAFLRMSPDFFKNKWKWSIFIDKFSNHESNMIRWICCHCVALITGMSEQQFDRIISAKLSATEALECALDYEHEMASVESNINDHVVCSEETKIEDISNSVVCVSGVYLNKYSSVATETPNLVLVESTKNNLHKIALAVASNKAVYLQGPVGSGKTTLVEYLACKTGRVLGESFIKVQLGDQTDSKMLLGTYICTDVPGEFIWQPGVLTQAITEGYWLLLEDIDSASLDIASLLNGLLESKSLSVPGYRDSIPVSSEFQLFLTHRLMPTVSGFHKTSSSTTVLLEKHVLQVSADPLTESELAETIQKLYPPLTTISSKLVDVFMLTRNPSSDGHKNSRLTSCRDLFKWCSRSVVGYDVANPKCALNVLQNAKDVFCSFHADAGYVFSLTKSISTCLGITNAVAEHHCNIYKPECMLTADNFKVGRVCLPRNNETCYQSAKFCFTRNTLCLLEQVACCVSLKEPVLLVGETGTGKTSTVQYLASVIGQKLIVINMNQQSDSSDLLGGFKPVDIKLLMAPVKNEFEEIFTAFFNVEQNKEFLSKIILMYNKEQWLIMIKTMKQCYLRAISRLNKEEFTRINTPLNRDVLNSADKALKHAYFYQKWSELGVKLNKLEMQVKHKHALAFDFIKGSLIKAIENGHWVLLDEINLANAETLECLSGLLESPNSSISLLEKGDKKPVRRNPDFTLFACMNPSNDVGKKDLPPGLRNRFTELYVGELTDSNDLLLLVNYYLEAMSLSQDKLKNIVKFYLQIKKKADAVLTDSLGHKPHFSLRSLCRALFIASKNPCGTFMRSLYEAFQLSFLTQLDHKSYQIVLNDITKYIVGSEKTVKSLLKQQIPKPKTDKSSEYLQFEGYWIRRGSVEPEIVRNYILTQSVKRNLKDLVRIVSIGKLPVLLQGETSVGKTSLIMYLAKASGNKCLRINNHEHTDLQEYIGTYIADNTGKLVFKEGLLAEAMRKGYWIILDELNLAPSDVLEALNRVIDDNRELYIPETQTVIKADPNFMLFATQNPPGLYGGRKMLSRAFRNRFIELHFNEIPLPGLEFILHKKCEIPESYAKKMIAVMKDLQLRRRGSAAFAGKSGFITLRDLFRWGERYRLANKMRGLYDWEQHLADEGYLVLAGRVRNDEERKEIIDVIQKHMKRQVMPENLFTLNENTSQVTKSILMKIKENSHKHKNIVWTYNMRKLGVLVSKALEFKEPVLLVGETGGGKTTICKLLADINDQPLTTINCNLNSESSDFIGGLRPVRDHSEKSPDCLFEWVDGPLITAMINGHYFLCDEISLAEDSVLERLNSLLEPERSLLLSEKGFDINNSKNTEVILAHEKFHFIGTMNPGGDFGKRELSLALRNRFTEIWCDTCDDRSDLIAIIERNVREGISLGNQEDGSSGFGNCIMDFIEWFKKTDIGKRFTVSIRDVLTWTNAINAFSHNLDAAKCYYHGACLTFLDSLGSGVTGTESTEILLAFQNSCIKFITNQVKEPLQLHNFTNLKLEKNEDSCGIWPFYINVGNSAKFEYRYCFGNKSTFVNAVKLFRAMQLNKAILLEGSPGVGKTSLVTALASFAGHRVCRINLSDQTDISDLFGADLPVENSAGGHFAWKDGPLLQALKRGHWILLDELNLASQSVLEGLNSCLDHRGEITIPELGKTFVVKKGTRFFGCQNPLKQGGSRRGLPKSFLNRFVQVYVSPPQKEDLIETLKSEFPQLPQEMLQQMVSFNKDLVRCLSEQKLGSKGAPWDYNLRDLIRWCEVTIYHYNSSESIAKKYSPESLVQLIYSDRMRTLEDKEKVAEIFERHFTSKVTGNAFVPYINKDSVRVGDVELKRCLNSYEYETKLDVDTLILRSQLGVLRSVVYCVNMNWMSILVGGPNSGKSSIVRTLASLAGKSLHVLPITTEIDTTEILGGFEQTNYIRHLHEISTSVKRLVFEKIRTLSLSDEKTEANKLLSQWEDYNKNEETEKSQSMQDTIFFFTNKMKRLLSILERLQEKIVFENEANEIRSLRGKIKNFLKLVEKENSLNAGGKFEWVDSLLVKCLQEGSWLLIDNVNLCSPAVLDRLNGLLEPNGTLIIGERGVDKDGNMIEIHPHKDFRLFLTMDPKNGEISRAMRNRGVEIFVLDIDNDLDLKSIVNNTGLKCQQHIEITIEIHNYVKDIVYANLNVTHLLNFSFLIAQQLTRGIAFEKALKNTVAEIYIKPRHCNDFKIADAEKLILEKVQSHLFEMKQKETFNDSITIKTNHLRFNSEIAKIKQQTSCLRQYLKTSEDSTGVFEKYFLMHFYTTTSVEDLETRHSYLCRILKGSPQEVLMEISRRIYDYFKNQTIVVNKTPVDYRWLGDVNKFHDIIEESRTNCLNLQIYYIIKHTDEIFLKKTSKNLKRLQSIHDTKKDDPFISIVHKNAILLCDTYDVFIKEILSNETVKVTDDQFAIILFLLKWRFIFVESTNECSDNADEIDNNLELHYKWFYKKSLKELCEVVKIIPSASLMTLTNKINLKCLEFSPVSKTAKRYQRVICKPKPIADEEVLKCVQLYREFLKRHVDCSSLKTTKILCDRKDLQKRLIDLKLALVNDITNFESDLNEIQKVFEEAVTKIDNENSMNHSKLISVTDYLAFLCLNRLRNTSDLKTNVATFQNICTIPSTLAGAIIHYDLHQNAQVKHEIKAEVFKYITDAFCLRLNTFDDSPKKSNSHSANLCYLLGDIVMENVKGECKIVVPTLDSFSSALKERRLLSLILWGNINQICSNKYDCLHNEVAYVRGSFLNFLSEFSRSLGFDEVGDFKTLSSKCQQYLLEIDGEDVDVFVTLLKQCTEEMEKFDDGETLIPKLIVCSNIYMLLNYLKCQLNSYLPKVDPLVKARLKEKYYLESKQDLEILKRTYELQNEVLSGNEKVVHRYHGIISEQIDCLQEKGIEFSKNVAVRPKHIPYSSVFCTIKKATSLLSGQKFLHFYRELDVTATNLMEAIEESKNIDLEQIKKLANSSYVTLNSYNNIIKEINEAVDYYPDILRPFLSNILEFAHGVKLKLELLDKLINIYNDKRLNVDLQFLLQYLSRFPTLDDKQNDYLQLVEADKHFKKYLSRVLSSNTIKDKELLRLLKCNIQECFNFGLVHIKSSTVIDRNILQRFHNLLSTFIFLYNKQEEAKEKEKNESDSLYKTKTVQDEEEKFVQLFHTFDTDFPDFIIKETEDEHPEKLAETTKIDTITPDDLNFVSSLHVVFLNHCAKTEWFIPPSCENRQENYEYPLVEKYKLFKLLLEHAFRCLNYTLDRDVLSGINVLLNYKDDFHPKDGYNFYEDPNTEEVKCCYRTLKDLQSSLAKLLDSWPENPVLLSIKTVMDRIFNFEVTSPVARFLTGLELLLEKCYEWEKVAHSGVSMKDNIEALHQQIKAWRKIEFSMWRSCLDHVHKKMLSPISKWWVHMFTVTMQFINKEINSTSDLVDTLQKFITNSNLAEFENRINLLLVFHCHVLYLDDTRQKKTLMRILWNLYNYYLQFLPIIKDKIKEVRAPVEKKLKDQIKIRLKDKNLNYWTMSKTHRVLNQFVKDYEKALNQAVLPFLVYTPKLTDEIKNTGNTLLRDDEGLDFYLSKNGGSKLKKNLQALCLETLRSTKYHVLLNGVEEFITDITDTHHSLKKVEIDKSQPIEKQKSQAKSILQIKRGNLVLLFKNLMKVGISFKTGLMLSNTVDSLDYFSLKPIDLRGFSYCVEFNTEADEALLNEWKDSEVFYSKSLILTDFLQTALNNPSKDIGVKNLERCKGFVLHLLDLTHEQKLKLIKSTRLLYYMQYYKNVFDKLSDKPTVHVDTILKLQELLKNVLITVKQYRIFLNTCPQDVTDEDLKEVPILESETTSCIFKRNLLIADADSILQVVQKTLTLLEKSKCTIPAVDSNLIFPKHLTVSLGEIIPALNTLEEKLTSAREIFSDVAFVKSFNWILNTLALLKQELSNTQKQNILTSEQLDHLKNSSKLFKRQVLLIVQNLYKKHSEIYNEINVKEVGLYEEHLKSLIANISNDFELLKMKNVFNMMNNIAQIVNTHKCHEYNTVIKQLLPTVDQLLLMYKYYVKHQIRLYRISCKMNVALLNTFIDLITNGFGIPSELMPDENASGQTNASGGMGLGEGEGQNDVSDRIESEDQLEDAQLPGQEKEEPEDKKCEEEDKGIEMSEDFDSKLQDVNKKEDDEEDESELDSDAEEQMGETEKGADQLDKNIWGSDIEEDIDESQEGDEEKGNNGEREGEQQLAPKEDTSANDDNQKPDAPESKEKQQKEINEMDEPELDDNQIDPYHYNQQELPEPEPMDLPDNMQLDDGQENNEEMQEENPFDVDQMKENLPPEQENGDETNIDDNEETKKDEENDDNEEMDMDDETSVKDDANKTAAEDTNEEDNADNKNEGVDKKDETENGDEKENTENLHSTEDETRSKENNIEAMDVDDADNLDNVQANQAENQKSTKPIEDYNQEDSPDKEGVGQSQVEDAKTGHTGQTTAEQNLSVSEKEMQENEQEKRQKPGDSNEKRSLGDVSESVKKKLKTIDISSADDTDTTNQDKEAEMYQHIEDAKESNPQVLDAATKEQAESQILDKKDEMKEDTESDLNVLDEPENEPEITDVQNLHPEKLNTENENTRKDSKNQHPEGEKMVEDTTINVEGEIVSTETVMRPAETTYFTNIDLNRTNYTSQLTADEINKIKSEVTRQLSLSAPHGGPEAEKMWQKITSCTLTLAQELSEQLRLVLEPTRASRLRGDYRTGRRINMRKVIPYIASDFRKDKIWLRRTKPSKRDYQIVLAIDDSESMTNNNSKELAFESVALISKALTLLESGQLSVLSFGKSTEIVHKLNEPFTETSGATILQRFTFLQKETLFHSMLDFATQMLNDSEIHSNALYHKLLVIISDGRGVNSKGEKVMEEAVRRATSSNVFLIFIIIDNPENKQSVLDISNIRFDSSGNMITESYMDRFPFPFYIILRDINLLPSVLSDALRQWFEVVSSADKQ